MKITTWNVAGLRAMMRKNGWTWLKAFDPDVICLREIKANLDQIAEADRARFSPYTMCWNGAERKGYSGSLDYFLVSEPLASVVEDVETYADVLGSDHCPVTLTLCYPQLRTQR